MNITKNIEGAWVIFTSELGYRKYYGYSKKQAIAKYKQELREVM